MELSNPRFPPAEEILIDIQLQEEHASEVFLHQKVCVLISPTTDYNVTWKDLLQERLSRCIDLYAFTLDGTCFIRDMEHYTSKLVWHLDEKVRNFFESLNAPQEFLYNLELSKRFVAPTKPSATVGGTNNNQRTWNMTEAHNSQTYDQEPQRRRYNDDLMGNTTNDEAGNNKKRKLCHADFIASNEGLIVLSGFVDKCPLFNPNRITPTRPGNPMVQELPSVSPVNAARPRNPMVPWVPSVSPVNAARPRSLLLQEHLPDASGTEHRNACTNSSMASSACESSEDLGHIRLAERLAATSHAIPVSATRNLRTHGVAARIQGQPQNIPIARDIKSRVVSNIDAQVTNEMLLQAKNELFGNNQVVTWFLLLRMYPKSAELLKKMFVKRTE